MGIPVEEIAEVVLALPSEARALLADRLVESLDPLHDPDIRAAWADEAQRRLQEVRTGQVQPVAAEEVHARVRAALK